MPVIMAQLRKQGFAEGREVRSANEFLFPTGGIRF